MCLLINNSLNSPKRMLTTLRDENGKRIVKDVYVGWKIISKGLNSQLYSRYKWQPKWNISDRPSPVLELDEMSSSQVNKGFHFYINKPNIVHANVARTHYKIKCIVLVDDIVAFGMNLTGNPCFVATKCYIKRLPKKRIPRDL